ncbi:putative ATP-dependent DNA helicase HFM1 [Varanus komodoensis]|nr:putative ATP-dependent DNA helicase HFM1 [Varanus komodoensis]
MCDAQRPRQRKAGCLPVTDVLRVAICAVTQPTRRPRSVSISNGRKDKNTRNESELAQLGCIPIQDFTLTQDISKIFRNGIRVTKWLSEFLASCQNNFLVLLNSLVLAKCFRCRLWENSPYVSKQLEKIGMTLSNAMVNAGLTSFKKIEDINARELELILNRHPPFGNQIKELVAHLPKYKLMVEQCLWPED